MKINLNNRGFFSFFLTLFLVISAPVFCQNFPPKPTSKIVSDFAKIYSNEENNLLEQKLLDYEKKTSTQIAIVTITSLDGYPIDDYAIKLANKWQIGQKGKNNGLLILIVSADHKIYIASGYGMEGVLNDGKLGSIIRLQMIPQFKNNNYFAGTNAGLDAIIAAAAGEYVNDGKNNVKDASFSDIVFFFILLCFLFIVFIRKNNGYIVYGGERGVGSRSGGGFGGFGGGSFGGGGAGGSW